MTDKQDFIGAFGQLLSGSLDAAFAQRSFNSILSGDWSANQIAAFLGALRAKGESPEVIAGAALSMRTAMIPVEHGFDNLLDTCGTGGDGTGTVNLSTGAAIICAALGHVVAKHGNRAASSKAGSADVLEALGIPTNLPASAASQLLGEVGIAFMMAPTHHPAMRFAGPVRKDLKVRTIFNCLGPLANPAGANHQLIGAFSDDLRPTLAATLRALGTRRAWVVRGEDGMDEVTPYGKTAVTQLHDGELSEFSVEPATFGVEMSPAGAVAGGTAAENAGIIREVLSGAKHPARNAFVLNAAAALVVAEGLEPKAAAARAAGALDDGSAAAKLDQWTKAAQALEPQA